MNKHVFFKVVAIFSATPILCSGNTPVEKFVKMPPSLLIYDRDRCFIECMLQALGEIIPTPQIQGYSQQKREYIKYVIVRQQFGNFDEEGVGNYLKSIEQTLTDYQLFSKDKKQLQQKDPKVYTFFEALEKRKQLASHINEIRSDFDNLRYAVEKAHAVLASGNWLVPHRDAHFQLLHLQENVCSFSSSFRMCNSETSHIRCDSDGNVLYPYSPEEEKKGFFTFSNLYDIDGCYELEKTNPKLHCTLVNLLKTKGKKGLDALKAAIAEDYHRINPGPKSATL